MFLCCEYVTYLGVLMCCVYGGYLGVFSCLCNYRWGLGKRSCAVCIRVQLGI